MQQVENKNVIEGENVEEYCITTAGNPDPTEMWTNITSGEHIKGNPLNITNINRAQAGDYKCTANNTCGEVSTVMNINVQCKNAIVIFLRELLVIKQLTEGLTRSCRRTTRKQFTKCVLLFPVDHDNHFFCSLESNVFDAVSLFQKLTCTT